MNLERIKRFVHPERYGFWLDPDGLFTLLGAISATAALFGTIGIPDAVRRLAEPIAGMPAAATVVGIAVCLVIARAFASLVHAWTPGDFEATGRFHAWIAAFGVILTLGIVVLLSWPLPGYVDQGAAGIAVRIVATGGYVLAGGIPLRRVLKSRDGWARGKVEELRRSQG